VSSTSSSSSSRQAYIVPLGIMVPLAALLLPLAPSRRPGAEAAVAAGLEPLDGLPAKRARSPFGARTRSPVHCQAEVTDLAESINRMLERVDARIARCSRSRRTRVTSYAPLSPICAPSAVASDDARTKAEIREALGAMERELDRATKLVVGAAADAGSPAQELSCPSPAS